ncbi:MAG TPA: FAD-binding oxidoreductase [Steroidobacteraceae bacterium]|jgi:glycine/D-amino acid oxidase-like deaminating enzyme|nr:FAD-binding oxidoreductase [Steroidobacteraceae bacterium]
MGILYRDTAEPAVPTPPLDGDARADAVVVGGGLTGLSTALHLAEGGAGVVLLEAEEPGWGASGRNGGQVNPGLKIDPDGVEHDFGADLGRRMNAFAGAAPDLVFELIARHGIRCDARRNGTLRAAVRAGHAAGVRTTTEQWARRGAPVELLEGAPLEAATGTPRYALAMLDRRGGDLNPLSFARGLAAAALRAGAGVHGGSRALGLQRAGAGWRVRTAAGTVSAAHLVLAGNGYTDALWPGLERTVVPLFGAIAATAPLAERALRQVMPSRAVLYESGAVTVYYRVDAGGRLLIGGRGPQEDVSEIRALGHLLRHAETLWPAVQGAAWTHAWGGRLAMTRDHYPHIHEPAPGVSICLGYNGRGVAMSTAMGAQLARRILGPSAPFDMPITAMKGIALHALWPLGVRAAIAYGRMKDALGF